VYDILDEAWTGCALVCPLHPWWLPLGWRPASHLWRAKSGRPSWTAARLGTHRADRRLRLENCRSTAGRCAQTAAAAAISAGGL